MRGRLEPSGPPTSGGSAATALESPPPPRSARLAVPVFARSGRNWLSAGGAGHGSVSGRDNRRSSGTWTMPARSPVAVREATRSRTRFTGGGGRNGKETRRGRAEISVEGSLLQKKNNK